MFSHLRLGAAAIICLFAISLAGPADAQHRQKSGSSVSSGAKAAPRSPQGGGPSAGPRPSQGSGPSRASGPPAGPRPSQGAGPAARPRPAGTPATGRAVPRPPYRPGSGGYYPGYGYRGHYPYYGYRGYYPYYGYRGYYPYYGYYPGFSWGFGAYFGPYYYSPWLYSSYSVLSAVLHLRLRRLLRARRREPQGGGQAEERRGVRGRPPGRHRRSVRRHVPDRLPLEAGEHEITVYQEGFRSIRQRLYLSPGSTYRIKGTLEPLAPGEANEPRPQPAIEQQEPQAQPAQPYRSLEAQGQPPGRQEPYRPAPEQYPPVAGDSRFGQVAIRVQPGDAEVLIDGEPWRNPAGADRLIVHLSPGTHRVEIRKEGYDAFVTAIEIRRGEVTPLNVSLARF